MGYELIHQFPGFAEIRNKRHELLVTNQRCLKLQGFKSLLAAEGTLYQDAKCAAAAYWETFTQQDDFILKTGIACQFLSYQRYADGEWRTTLGAKSAYIENNRIKGTILTMQDVTNSRLIDLSRFLISHQKNHYQTKSFSYLLNDSGPNYALSQREQETLFFLLRGKTARSIATILQLSTRTIETYVENLKAKFRCASKEILIEKAIAEGLMSMLPETIFALEVA